MPGNDHRLPRRRRARDSRVDSAAFAGWKVLPYYDSLVSKLLAHGRDRTEAIARMKRTLDMTVVEGIKTTISIHRRILDEADFVAGRLSTSFMDRFAVEKPAAGAGSLAAAG